eukprot:g2526.t1
MGSGGSVVAKLNAVKTDQDREFEKLLKNHDKLTKLWNSVDLNGNGICSLSEIERLIVTIPGLQKLNHKAAIRRAYKRTIVNQDEGDWVEKHEFPSLLQNIYYFNKLWKYFEKDDKDHDRRMQFEEFVSLSKDFGVTLTEAEAKLTFKRMDTNGGGMVLFDEFCRFVARMSSGAPVRLLYDDNFDKTTKEKLENKRNLKNLHGKNRKKNNATKSKSISPKQRRRLAIKKVKQQNLGLNVSEKCLEKEVKRTNQELKEEKKSHYNPNLVGKLRTFLLQSKEQSEVDFDNLLQDRTRLEKLWKILDKDNNGVASLAECERFTKAIPGFELFNNRVAMRRAYKHTVKVHEKDKTLGNSKGDPWVSKEEFPKLLQNIFYFTKLWRCFTDIEGDSTRSIDAQEFKDALELLPTYKGKRAFNPNDSLNSALTKDQANAEFKRISDGKSHILYDNFCVRFAQLASKFKPVKLPGLDGTFCGSRPSTSMKNERVANAVKKNHESAKKLIGMGGGGGARDTTNLLFGAGGLSPEKRAQLKKMASWEEEEERLEREERKKWAERKGKSGGNKNKAGKSKPAWAYIEGKQEEEEKERKRREEEELLDFAMELDFSDILHDFDKKMEIDAIRAELDKAKEEGDEDGKKSAEAKLKAIVAALPARTMQQMLQEGVKMGRPLGKEGIQELINLSGKHPNPNNENDFDDDDNNDGELESILKSFLQNEEKYDDFDFSGKDTFAKIHSKRSKEALIHSVLTSREKEEKEDAKRKKEAKLPLSIYRTANQSYGVRAKEAAKLDEFGRHGRQRHTNDFYDQGNIDHGVYDEK